MRASAGGKLEKKIKERGVGKRYAKRETMKYKRKVAAGGGGAVETTVDEPTTQN